MIFLDPCYVSSTLEADFLTSSCRPNQVTSITLNNYAPVFISKHSNNNNNNKGFQLHFNQSSYLKPNLNYNGFSNQSCQTEFTENSTMCQSTCSSSSVVTPNRYLVIRPKLFKPAGNLVFRSK